MFGLPRIISLDMLSLASRQSGHKLEKPTYGIEQVPTPMPIHIGGFQWVLQTGRGSLRDGEGSGIVVIVATVGSG